MNKWEPDNNPFQNRRISKTGEEVNELGAVLFRISNQGIDAIDPGTGKTNRQRLLEETADVLAQIQCNMSDLFSESDARFIRNRALDKREQMNTWEAHYKDRTYTTQPGESVAGIALRELGTDERWHEIAKLNEDRFPHMIHDEYYPVGTVLKMPAKDKS